MPANVSAAQEVPWFGKLRTKAEAAEAEVNVARADLAASELEITAPVPSGVGQGLTNPLLSALEEVE